MFFGVCNKLFPVSVAKSKQPGSRTWCKRHYESWDFPHVWRSSVELDLSLDCSKVTSWDFYKGNWKPIPNKFSLWNQKNWPLATSFWNCLDFQTIFWDGPKIGGVGRFGRGGGCMREYYVLCGADSFLSSLSSVLTDYIKTLEKSGCNFVVFKFFEMTPFGQAKMEKMPKKDTSTKLQSWRAPAL